MKNRFNEWNLGLLNRKRESMLTQNSDESTLRNLNRQSQRINLETTLIERPEDRKTCSDSSRNKVRPHSVGQLLILENSAAFTEEVSNISWYVRGNKFVQ